jgi:hypothetical protein
MKFIIPKNSLKTIQFVPSDENENHDGLGRTIMSEKEKNKILKQTGSTSAEGSEARPPKDAHLISHFHLQHTPSSTSPRSQQTIKKTEIRWACRHRADHKRPQSRVISNDRRL